MLMRFGGRCRPNRALNRGIGHAHQGFRPFGASVPAENENRDQIVGPKWLLGGHDPSKKVGPSEPDLLGRAWATQRPLGSRFCQLSGSSRTHGSQWSELWLIPGPGVHGPLPFYLWPSPTGPTRGEPDIFSCESLHVCGRFPTRRKRQIASPPTYSRGGLGGPLHMLTYGRGMLQEEEDGPPPSLEPVYLAIVWAQGPGNLPTRLARGRGRGRGGGPSSSS